MADTEELRLVVSLTDNASAQLSSIRGQIQNTFGPSAHAQLEQFQRKSDDTYRKLKELAEATTGVSKAFDFFTRGFGAAGIAIAGVGYAISAQLKNLKEYADHMTQIGNAASSLGAAPGTLRNFEEAFVRAGRSAGDALKVMQDIQKLQADLARPGSEIRAQLFQHVHTDEAVRNMERYLDRLGKAKTIEEETEVIRQGAEGVYRANLQYGEQIARQREKEFLAIQGISDAILDLHGKIREMSADEKAAFDARVAHAKAFKEQTDAIAQSWEHITDLWKDEALVSLLGVMEKIAASSKQYADNLEKANTAADKAAPAPGGWAGMDPFNPANVARERGARGAAGLPPLPGSGTHPLQLPPGDFPSAAPQFFAGGAGGGDQPFWQNWRRSTNIEDHRGLGTGGGTLAETNRQLEMLNDNLSQILHPLGAVGAPGGFGGGFGAFGGGGGFGGGGAGGSGIGGGGGIGAPISIPPGAGAGTMPIGGGGGGISTGGRRPHGSSVGPGSGAGAGESSPHGNIGGADPFMSGAGGGLAAQRGPLMAEVNKDPATKHLLYRMIATEGGGRGGQGAVEALFNRTAMIRQKIPGYSIADELHSGFYGPLNKGQGRGAVSQAEAARDDAVIGRVLEGSNIIQGRTDQGTFGDPNAAGPGRVSFPGMARSEIYNFWKGRRRGRDFSTADTAHWAAQENELAASDRTTMDAHAVQTHKVEASGKLTANINAPKGTDVTLEGGGAFTKIELNRQTQMEAARTGPGQQ
jgi:hypothetical protein